MKIVADDKIPFLKGALEPFAEVVYIPGKQINSYTLKDCDALLIRTRTKCNENLLKGTNVRFIGTATIGYDHIDTQYCSNNQITWTNAPGCNASSVGQYVASALVKVSYDNDFDLKEKTLGIIGVGNVGSKVEKFARSIGMNVLLNDPPRARAEKNKNFHNLEMVLSESDIVTVHVPLNALGEDRTFHLFDDFNFNKIKKGAWFFNSSRGEVVDSLALKKMLQTGILNGAVIDVWENEPDIDPELMQDVYFATPHIAGYSTDGKANGTAMAVNSLGKYFNLFPGNWYPDELPLPAAPFKSIDCNGKSDADIIRDAVIHTYNIEDDSSRLRHSPRDFEKLRGDYPVRREFPSFVVDLKGGTDRIRQILENIGFRMKV